LEMWKIELNGDANDILDLKQLAPCCDCALVAAPDAQYSLGGPAFDQVTTAEEMESKSAGILILLNGLARLERFEHRPVIIGERIYGPHSPGAPLFYGTHAPKDTRQPRSWVWEFAPPGFHSSDTPIVKDSEYARRKRIVSDPALAEILEAIAGEITWQRLRVAFEKICALVNGSTSKGSWDNSMVKLGYATQAELSRFKENVQDPRQSGIDAVHGVPEKSPLRKAKMTEKEGFAFVARLLNTYIQKKP
jgi:hypothetical protein